MSPEPHDVTLSVARRILENLQEDLLALTHEGWEVAWAASVSGDGSLKEARALRDAQKLAASLAQLLGRGGEHFGTVTADR